MNEKKKTLRIGEIAEYYGVHNKTIIRWCEQGKLKFRYTKGGQRVFDNPREQSNNKPREEVIYTRVSSSKQKSNGDLERQVKFMVNKFPGYKVIQDVGSGLNFKRKDLLSLLEQIKRGAISKVVVAKRDRLSRFGFEFFKWFCETHGTELLVLEQDKKSKEEELIEDIPTILHVFNCRINA